MICLSGEKMTMGVADAGARHQMEVDRRVGAWRLVELIGRGGFGEVWKALPVDAGTDGDVVALKIPTHQGYIRHLRREGAILADVDHPNIVRVLDCDVEGDPPYLAMEYVEGRSLRDAIERPGLLKGREVLSVAEQMLVALGHLHARGHVHRDLKPENVLLDGDGQVKLIDLGLGHVAERVLADAWLSVSLVSRNVPVAGTLAYMAPEQRRGEPPDPRSDLYAFGVILHELLTDQLPSPEIRVSDLRDDVSERFDVLVARLVHPDRERRPVDAKEARRLLTFTIRDREAVPVPAERSGRVAATFASDERLLRLASPFTAGQVIGEGLELLGLLGRGGFGEVWAARRVWGRDGKPGGSGEPAGSRHDALRKQVAVKIALDDAGCRGLVLEVEASKRVRHRSIPAVLEAHLEDEPPHLVMELVRGRNLRAVLLEQGRLDFDLAVRAIGGMLDVVAHCHRKGVVHRDLKPENFVLDVETGELRLLDFGLSQVEGSEREMDASLATGKVVGTLDYMAPEQQAGHEAGPAADVYALGVCTFEMLSGALPGGPQRLRQLVSVHEDVDRLVMDMLAANPDRRPTARQAMKRLRRIGLKRFSRSRQMGLRAFVNDLISMLSEHGVAVAFLAILLLTIFGLIPDVEPATPRAVVEAPAAPPAAAPATKPSTTLPPGPFGQWQRCVLPLGPSAAFPGAPRVFLESVQGEGGRDAVSVSGLVLESDHSIGIQSYVAFTSSYSEEPAVMDHVLLQREVDRSVARLRDRQCSPEAPAINITPDKPYHRRWSVDFMDKAGERKKMLAGAAVVDSRTVVVLQVVVKDSWDLQKLFVDKFFDSLLR